jgi:hypothetical protein
LSSFIYDLENIRTFPEINIITDINSRPWGSRIIEKDRWEEEIEIICHDRRIEVEEEKRKSLEGKVRRDRESIIIDARKGAMVIS